MQCVFCGHVSGVELCIYSYFTVHNNKLQPFLLIKVLLYSFFSEIILLKDISNHRMTKKSSKACSSRKRNG